MNTDEKTRERLRHDLPTIRSIAGWSAEKLAELLEVSRVTVVNLENTENKMTTVQYLAIRKLLDEEVKETNNEMLALAINTLVDSDNATEKQKNNLREQTFLAAKKVGRKAGSVAVGKAAVEALTDLKLSELPQESIVRGEKYIDNLLADSSKAD